MILYPVVGALCRLWVWAIQRGVRYEHRGPLFDFARERRACIVVFWHQDVFSLFFELIRILPEWHPLFMVSPGRTGSLGVYLLDMFGIECVTGSSGSKGWAAVDELARRAKDEGRPIFLTADGSRGPTQVARWGSLNIARDSGLPIIPARGWASHFLTLHRTWMKLAVPMPWGRGVILSGEPIAVPGPEPGDAGRNDTEKNDITEILEPYRQQLQASLDSLVDEADRFFE